MRKSIVVSWQQIKSLAPSAAVLTLLVSLAVWGHESHWKFSCAADADDQGDARPLATTTVAATSPAAELPDAADDSGGPDDPRPAVDMAPTRIRFSSREAIEKAGIETADAEEHSISQEIIANGVISYDQTRLAQISARPRHRMAHRKAAWPALQKGGRAGDHRGHGRRQGQG